MKSRRDKVTQQAKHTPTAQGRQPTEVGHAEPKRHDRRAVLAICLFLLIVTVIVFAQAVNHDDDVYENPRVTGD